MKIQLLYLIAGGILYMIASALRRLVFYASFAFDEYIRIKKKTDPK